MAKDANRFWVNACIEIYVPDQGFGEKAMSNEELDAHTAFKLEQLKK